MYRACIALVDASRARLFTFERTAEAEGLKDELIEQRDFVNPARRRRPSQLFSDTRPALGRTGTLQYGTDDHRDAHVEAFDIEFSRLIAGELAALVKSARADRVIICASPRMLGELREASKLPRNVVVDEVPRDLVKLTVPRLREQLVSYGLLPVRPNRMHA
jgi:protein required for attachment to host cells